MSNYLWKAYPLDFESRYSESSIDFYIESPDEKTKIIVGGQSKEFVRALCNLLNSSPIHKLQMSNAEMDSRGVPGVEYQKGTDGPDL